MPKYIFVGDGAGVPGMPHEITQAEVEALNGDELAEFSMALSSGLYVEVTETKPVRKPKSTKAETAPSEGAKQ